MAHATRGIAATFVASTLALAACGSGENARGGGPAKNQGNMTEEPFAPPVGKVDTPANNPAEQATQNGPAYVRDAESNAQ